LVFTSRNFVLSRRTFELTEQGQVTDRYTKAIDVRIGGIYALERIARDSERDHPTVVEVLIAFIREHSHEPWPTSEPGTNQASPQAARADVRAAIAVVGRRDARRDIRPIELTRANLAGADLIGADLTRANLSDANLTGANLTDANLAGASLFAARLDGANLTRAHLGRANLTLVSLNYANLSAANFQGANLSAARLGGANLGGADLGGADLAAADILGRPPRPRWMGGTNLTDTLWPEDAPVPEGWKLDTSSGRLTPAESSPGSGEAN